MPKPLPTHERLSAEELDRLRQLWMDPDVKRDEVAQAIGIGTDALLAVVAHLGLPRKSKGLGSSLRGLEITEDQIAAGCLEVQLTWSEADFEHRSRGYMDGPQFEGVAMAPIEARRFRSR